MDLDRDQVAIQVIHLDPHQGCIQTGANDRVDLVLQQTRAVHQVISVEEVVIPVVIPVVIQAVAVMDMPVAMPVAMISVEEVPVALLVALLVALNS